MFIWKFLLEMTEVGPYFWTFLHFFLRKNRAIYFLLVFPASWKFLRENTEVVLIFGLLHFFLRHNVVGAQFISNWDFVASWK